MQELGNLRSLSGFFTALTFSQGNKRSSINIAYLAPCSVMYYFGTFLVIGFTDHNFFIDYYILLVFAGFFFDVQEIIPFVRGDFRFDPQNNPIKKFPSPENEIRAIIEGQFIAKRAHAESLGFTIGKECRCSIFLINLMSSV